jgi:hypothetical protein
VEARGMADAGNETVKADGRRCPKCGALINHLDYWERAINTGEYWRDGFRDVIPSDVDEFYFLCPECGKILFNDIELPSIGQSIEEGEALAVIESIANFIV